MQVRDGWTLPNNPQQCLFSFTLRLQLGHQSMPRRAEGGRSTVYGKGVPVWTQKWLVIFWDRRLSPVSVESNSLSN
jgi:hypothetical protein